MNKRQLKKIINLFKEGISTEVCIAIILELMGKNSTDIEKGIAIHAFYEEIFNLELKQESKL